jgi:hypothetical protein
MAISKVQYSSSQNYSPSDNENSPQIYGNYIFTAVFTAAYHLSLWVTCIKSAPSSCVSWSSIQSRLKLLWSVPCTPFPQLSVHHSYRRQQHKTVHKRRRLYPAKKILRHIFSDIHCGYCSDDGHILGFTLRRVRGIFRRFRMTCCFHFSVSPKRRNKTNTLRGIKTQETRI